MARLNIFDRIVRKHMNVVSEDDTFWIIAQHQPQIYKAYIVNIDKNKIKLN